MSEDEFKIQFSNYERTVWVVNSIEGHLLKYYRDLIVCFDRFPRFPQSAGAALTPDFAVSFISDFNIIGEIKRSLGAGEKALGETYDQLCRYDQVLRFRRSPDGPHERAAKSHDIVLFTNIEYARKEAKRLRALVRSQGKPTRHIIIFSVAFDGQQAKPKWIFSCLTDLSDRFSDAALPVEKRLSKRHQDDEESLVIYTNEFAGIQTQHAFCNDNPPPVYTAVILWAKVFPRLIPQEKRADWTLEENNQGTIEFTVSLEALITEKNRLRLAIRKQQVVDALSLLETGKVVVRNNNEFTIRYRKFRAAVGHDLDEAKAAELAIDHTKHGLIREISRGISKPNGKKQRIVRPTRSKKDSNQTFFDL